MKTILRNHHSTLADLNITPLLDLVFVLLVIFIITTPQLMNNLELSLPSGKTRADQPALPVRVQVIGRDQIELNGAKLNFAGFKAELSRRQKAQPDLAVVVAGGGQADYQAVVNVLEAIHQLNITQIGLTAAGAETLQTP